MIRTLAKSIREYKKASILAPIIIACEVILECFIPFVTKGLIEHIESGNIDMMVITR